MAVVLAAELFGVDAPKTAIKWFGQATNRLEQAKTKIAQSGVFVFEKEIEMSNRAGAGLNMSFQEKLDLYSALDANAAKACKNALQDGAFNDASLCAYIALSNDGIWTEQSAQQWIAENKIQILKYRVQHGYKA